MRIKSIFKLLGLIAYYLLIGFVGFVYLAVPLLTYESVMLELGKISNKVDIYEFGRRDTMSRVLTMISLLEENDRSQLSTDMSQQEIIKDLNIYSDNLNKKLNTLDKKQLEVLKSVIANSETILSNRKYLEEKIKYLKSIDLENAKTLKAATYGILNADRGVSGSGAHIKLQNKDYILTCAHLMEDTDKFIWLTEGSVSRPLGLIKLDREKDLALFRVYGIENSPYIEISDEYPEEGSTVIVIGNPDSLEDVITEGVIADINKYTYLLTNTIYSGNSGGPVIYKNKIVGVTSGISVYFNFPLIVNYGICHNLTAINEFLEEYK